MLLLALCSLLFASAALADQDVCIRPNDPAPLLSYLASLADDLQAQANTTDTKRPGGTERMSRLSVQAQAVRNAMAQIVSLSSGVSHACGLVDARSTTLQVQTDAMKRIESVLDATMENLRTCQARKAK